MSEIRLRVDDALLPLLGESPEEIERHALEMIVLELYRRRASTAGRAAELLHMETLAFVRWTGALGIPYFDLSGEELRDELRVLGGRPSPPPSRGYADPRGTRPSVLGEGELDA